MRSIDRYAAVLEVVRGVAGVCGKIEQAVQCAARIFAPFPDPVRGLSALQCDAKERVDAEKLDGEGAIRRLGQRGPLEQLRRRGTIWGVWWRGTLW